MSLNVDLIDNFLIVKIFGELDHHSCDEIRNKLDKEIMVKNPKNLVFDMESLNFMDSSGIGVIIGRYKKILLSGGKVGIINIKPQVKRIYDICGLNKIIPLYNDLKQAMKSM